MPEFEYCPPFAVFDASVSGVDPVFETLSLQTALLNLRNRPNSTLSISVLVTDGNVSTLIPVALRYADLGSNGIEDAQEIIQSFAVQRFRSIPVDASAVSA